MTTKKRIDVQTSINNPSLEVTSTSDNYDNSNVFLCGNNNPKHDELYQDPACSVDEIVYGINPRQAFDYLDEMNFEEEMRLTLNDRTEKVKSLLFRRNIKQGASTPNN